MMSKELLLSLIEARSNPEEIGKRIEAALADAREGRPDLVAFLPPELMELMDSFIVSGLRIGYVTALMDVRDDVAGCR